MRSPTTIISKYIVCIILNISELTAHLVAFVTAPLWQVYRGAVSAPGREPGEGPQCAQQLPTGRTHRNRDARSGTCHVTQSLVHLTDDFQYWVFPFIYRDRGKQTVVNIHLISVR